MKINKISVLNIFNYLLIFNIFGGGFVLFNYPFEFYLGYIFIILFLILYFFSYRNIDMNPFFIGIIIILSVNSFINVFLQNVTFFRVIKQILGISVTGTAYYLLIKANDYDLDVLFKIYLRIALVVAVIGIIQEFSYLLNFRYGYYYGYIITKWKYYEATGGPFLRVNSIFAEPSHLATSMAPAAFISLRNILRNKTIYLSHLASAAVLLCYILTISILAYVVILLSLLLIYLPYFNKTKKIILVLILIIMFSIVYICVPEISMRVNSVMGIATGSIKISDSHLSIYAIASNAFVAYKSFLNNPLFGSGLGSHPISYDKFIRLSDTAGVWQREFPEVNKEDAASLLIRLLSECGLFGVLVVLYFIFRFRITKRKDNNMQLINTSILSLFILHLLRQGHYFYSGLFFFVWLYYFSYKIDNNELKRTND